MEYHQSSRLLTATILRCASGQKRRVLQVSSRSFFDGLFRAPFDGFVSAAGDQSAGRMRFSGSLVLRKVKGGYLSKEMDWLRMPVRYGRKRRCPILDCRCARRRWFCAGRDGTMPDRTKGCDFPLPLPARCRGFRKRKRKLKKCPFHRRSINFKSRKSCFVLF